MAQHDSADSNHPYHQAIPLSHRCEGCGKEYATSHHLNHHQQSCHSTKRTLSILLNETRSFWESRKRRKLNNQSTASREDILGPGSNGSMRTSSMGASTGDTHIPPAEGRVNILVTVGSLRGATTGMDSRESTEQVEQCQPFPSGTNVAMETEHISQDARHSGPQQDRVGALEGRANVPAETYDDLDMPVAQRKAKRNSRLPARYRDEDALPQPLPAPVRKARRVQPVEHEGHQATTQTDHPHCDPPRQGSPRQPAHPPRQITIHTSDRNVFGLLRQYAIPEGHTITHDPDGAVTLRSLTNSSVKAIRSKKKKTKPPHYGPFTTKSAFLLADWYWNSGQKSFADFQQLIQVFKEPDFSVSDIVSVNWKEAFRCLGANREDVPIESAQWIEDEGWKSTRVTIDVPFHNRMRGRRGFEQHYVGQFRHRNLVSVIKEKILNVENSRYFHYYPYRTTWQATEASPEVDVYGELYTSRAFREAHEDLQRCCLTDKNKDLERVVVALMFWSDSTHLTSFGTASLWPCYLFFGNESKYRRCQPSEQLGEQVAYFIKVLSACLHIYVNVLRLMPYRCPKILMTTSKRETMGGSPLKPLQPIAPGSFCKRSGVFCWTKNFNTRWRRASSSLVLMGESVASTREYLHIRRIILRSKFDCYWPVPILTSMLLNRVQLAGIRLNATCPCHRCLIEKPNISHLSSPKDIERQDKVRNRPEQEKNVDDAIAMIKRGYAFQSTYVRANAEPIPYVVDVLLQNAFRCLSRWKFDISSALVVDLLHEFEIGVWKRLFIHLMRLLDTFTCTAHLNGNTLTAELDSRYRATPIFGRGTIRKFGTDASAMKRKAARDYEDLLQCAIPAFDGLLPEPHNTILMKLLYICAQWHALAKLRLHHEFTVGLLEYTTVHLGAQMRRFDLETCRKVTTRESQKEADARARKEGAGKVKGSASRRPVAFNIYTIKFHFLGDYPACIRKYGTSDSYSTETGELYHRLPKSWFDRTDKRDFEQQLTKMERRQARLGMIRTKTKQLDGLETLEDQVDFSPGCRYALGANRSRVLYLSSLAHSSETWDDDPYAADFIPKLKQHLLPRIVEMLGYEGGISDPDAWANVVLKDDRIYSHKIMHLNYTTYDVRRDEDVIHLDTPQCNVMLLDADYDSRCQFDISRSHPYLYAKIVGIFHADVQYHGVEQGRMRSDAFQRLDFVLAHWYSILGPRDEFALDRLALVPLHCDTAVTFIDPADIIRATHVIPQFSLGKQEQGVGKSLLVGAGAQDLWNAYLVNRFADRDLFMRYQYGMSIGHTYMRHPTFPPPAVPPIPANFDYYLVPPSVPKKDSLASSADPPTTSGEAEVSTATDVDELSRAKEMLTAREGGELATAEERRETPSPGECGEPSIMGGMPKLPILDRDNAPMSGLGLKGQEEGDFGDVEDRGDSNWAAEERDYMDDLDDQEVAALDDMYGDEVWDDD
ncbi:hypothetical protein NMY22_g12407 [Coprinellus aureogranulatus]|nr:hypothetical protein NMY22_g12407 [Coprinellus aureogranulatus]